jgi:tripartite-type tricarboxylate transporter receptor subunit TctC
MKRRTFNAALASSLTAPWLGVHAQSYPSKPTRWVVPYPAGGGSDTYARWVAQPLSQLVKQPVTVDNKPGANGAIAIQDLKRSPSDGYTLVNVDNGVMVYNPALYKSLTYAPATDLTMVTQLGGGPLVLMAGASAPFKDARDFIEQVKAAPGKFSYASAGAGSPQHLAMELLKVRADLRLLHIPYRGSTPALADVLGGQIPVLMTDFTAAAGFVSSGKLRPLAVTGLKRHPRIPDVPTFEEVGIKGVLSEVWVGVAVRSDTPAEIVQTLYQHISTVLKQPDVITKMEERGALVLGSTPEQANAVVRRETEVWHKLIRDLKISLD